MLAHPIPITSPHVSVNRVRIVDLPGLPLDDEVRGQKAYHLLSNYALIRYARQQAETLQLPPAYLEDTPQTRLELPRLVDRSLDNPKETVRTAAQTIARRLGRNLGHILLTLHRGDPINREARLDWTAADWEHWAAIERIWLGGGLMSGRLGALVIQYARHFLTETGYADRLQVRLTPYRRAMTILGAARYLPAGTYETLCFDFGQTSVKRTCLRFEEGTLVGFRYYPSLPVALDAYKLMNRREWQIGQQMFDFVTEVIVKTLAAYGANKRGANGIALGSDLMLCIAAYVDGGRLLGNGLYAKMSLLADDVRPLLAEAVKSQTGQVVQIHPIHDGTAACTLHAGEQNSAVITIGTAMGVGFPPADEIGLRPLAERLETFSQT